MDKLLVLSILAFFSSLALAQEKAYIVFLEGDSLLVRNQKNPNTKNAAVAKAYSEKLRKNHDAILSSLPDEDGSIKKTYSYVNAINGFAASLNQDQVAILKENKEVRYVLEDRKLRPTTSYTPRFLKLEGGSSPVWTRTTGKDIIIGLLDTGIFPESSSFSDAGLGPIPSKFKGICQKPISGPSIRCNRKLIGARYFYKGYETEENVSIASTGDYVSARDTDGHGTHCASTAGGSKVLGAHMNGQNIGNVSGVAFDARISAYKVCWGFGIDNFCSTQDIIAGLESGISDGVDVFSVSLGDKPMPYYEDPWALYLLEVAAAGIPTALSAGSSGGVGTLHNSAPWVLTVAASTHDRDYTNNLASVILGDGQSFQGMPSPDWSILNSKNFPLVNSVSAPLNNNSTLSAELCFIGSLNPALVSGKVVLCKRGSISMVDKSAAVNKAGGIGMILYNQEGVSSLFIQPHSVPSIHVPTSVGLSIIKYLNSSRNPTARAKGATGNAKMIFGPRVRTAPSIADYSSTGPNAASWHVLKPDITAPGSDVIAAYTNFSSKIATSRGLYAQLSGTSMATPHVAGAIALIKSFFPTWKPSWIYSSIITTGSTLNNVGKCIKDSYDYCATPLHMGGGHLDVRKALNPGLVYDMSRQDYRNFLCTRSGGYYQNSSKCSRLFKEVHFNLPYLSIPDFKGRVMTTRRLVLVGPPGVYNVSVKHPAGARVSVSPTSLSFTKFGQILSYQITAKAITSFRFAKVNYDLGFNFTFGSITWSDGTRNVKANVAVNIP